MADITMPQLGESVTEGTVTRWLKKEGERVEADEPLLEVSTDKVDTEAVAATLPHGVVTVKAVKGGLDVPDQAGGDVAIIASAAVAVRLDLP